ncbi:hypothetical protein [Flavobacterium sp. FlaQc-47]|uniref:hypothetical protein n=1 Tax=Flavobacterium sp. FlaQc-47 TaxID=3374180 RepID=UPI00375810CB
MNKTLSIKMQLRAMSVNSGFNENKLLTDLSQGSEQAFTILYDTYKMWFIPQH